MLRRLRRTLASATVLLGLVALGGCTAPGLILTATGIATDTSMTWDIVKHVHAKLTEDDPTPCILLDTVQRALNARCDYVAGRIRTADIAHNGLQACPLAAATQDARLWRALPELIDKGAKLERCPRSPLQDLAEVDACPNFAAASPEVLHSLAFMADSDPRAIRHDVFRMLSCPNARSAGLDRVLVGWLDRGKLEPGSLSFNPLEALDPGLIGSRFARDLQVAGHSPQTALDHFEGTLPSGFEEALRTSNWTALEWWFYELPKLVNEAPPSRGAQLASVPLQQVLLPGFLRSPTSQADMVQFLMAHGADPRKKLPFDSGTTVIGFATAIKSPVLALLDPPHPTPAAPTAASPTTLAQGTLPVAAEVRRTTARAARDNAAKPMRQAARYDVKEIGGDITSR
ncbi:MAG: hypothetical protein ABIZ18_02075 [Caldimonas sp.]